MPMSSFPILSFFLAPPVPLSDRLLTCPTHPAHSSFFLGLVYLRSLARARAGQFEVKVYDATGYLVDTISSGRRRRLLQKGPDSATVKGSTKTPPAVKKWSKAVRERSQKARTTAPKKEEDRELVGTGFTCKLSVRPGIV